MPRSSVPKARSRYSSPSKVGKRTTSKLVDWCRGGEVERCDKRRKTSKRTHIMWTAVGNAASNRSGGGPDTTNPQQLGVPTPTTRCSCWALYKPVLQHRSSDFSALMRGRQGRGDSGHGAGAPWLCRSALSRLWPDHPIDPTLGFAVAATSAPDYQIVGSSGA